MEEHTDRESIGHGSSDGFTYRRLGSRAEDLEIDFLEPSRPHLVTQILCHCVYDDQSRQLEPEACWQLTVGTRVAYLLRVIAAEGAKSFTVQLRCRERACGQPMALELSLKDLLSQQRLAEEQPLCFVATGSSELRVRRPRGEDQRRWELHATPDPRAFRDTMLRSLVSEPSELVGDEPIPDDLADTVGERLRAIDPLVSYRVGVRCPCCGDERHHSLDLQELLVEHLERGQRSLLLEVHRLATRYHWSEAEILALPPARRARYLALIEGDTK